MKEGGSEINNADNEKKKCKSIMLGVWLITAIRMGWRDGLGKIRREWVKGGSRKEGISRLMKHEVCTWDIPEIPRLLPFHGVTAFLYELFTHIAILSTHHIRNFGIFFLLVCFCLPILLGVLFVFSQAWDHLD